jgi:hypothetical protein
VKAGVAAGLLELLGETHAKDLTLETVLGSELVKVMEIQNRVPWHVRYTKLTADGVNLVADILGSASAIVGNLPGVVTSNAYFGQHGHVLLERKVLADSPVEGKPVARCKVEILLLSTRVVRQSRYDCRGLAGHRVPRHRALHLLLPETVPDVVDRLDGHGTTDTRQSDCLYVVLADRGENP